MSFPASTSLRELANHATKAYCWWLVPTLLTALSATIYSFVRPEVWRASQVLMVRDEAFGGLGRLGTFEGTDAMKTAQETILEIARDHRVVVEALREVGPPTGVTPRANKTPPTSWPDATDVEQAREHIAITTGKGAEFGRSEVIYLAAESQDAARAIALTSAVCNQLETQLKELRNVRAQSIIAELADRRALAQADLDRVSAQLQSMEAEVGSDLSELRLLQSANANGGTIANSLVELEHQLTSARAARDETQKLRDQIAAARDVDFQDGVATSRRLLESQPSLRGLKDALVTAQQNTARLLGTMSPAHPEVQSAEAAENEIRQQLRSELNVALRGVESELRVNETLIQSLETQQATMSARLQRVARLRTHYGQLVAEVEQHTTIVEQAQKDLADARARQAGAQSSSLLTRWGEPQTGGQPLGPSRAVLILSGLGGGLLTGFGCLFLVTPFSSLRGRRATDSLGIGRRLSDRISGPPAPPVGPTGSLG